MTLRCVSHCRSASELAKGLSRLVALQVAASFISQHGDEGSSNVGLCNCSGSSLESTASCCTPLDACDARGVGDCVCTPFVSQTHSQDYVDPKLQPRPMVVLMSLHGVQEQHAGPILAGLAKASHVWENGSITNLALHTIMVSGWWCSAVSAQHDET